MTKARIVIVAYKPKADRSEKLRRLIATHVARLRAEGLVTDRVPITMEAKDGTIIEVFEWASKEAIEAAHSNSAVTAMWEEFAAVCDYLPISNVAEASELFSEFTPLDSGF